MAPQSSKRPNRPAGNPAWLSWNGLIYYGETVGFLFAWIAGVAAILSATQPATEKAVDQVAVVAPAVR
ncbi:hypothetical protein [Botrimarina sp.]|uniref:hypothetical protein n=1 Tax=Botrimarina sp. TaxID=2795802 RepID=UPI0032EF5B85